MTMGKAARGSLRVRRTVAVVLALSTLAPAGSSSARVAVGAVLSMADRSREDAAPRLSAYLLLDAALGTQI
jgi:hypothetical protein